MFVFVPFGPDKVIKEELRFHLPIFIFNSALDYPYFYIIYRKNE